MRTSLGIWALGSMVTRFVPGGYQPEHAGETTAAKVERAVAGLGELMDDYEFHYPQELSEENVDEVRAALGGHGIYAIATGTHLNPRYGKGGLSSPDDAVRADALEERVGRVRHVTGVAAAARRAGRVVSVFAAEPGLLRVAARARTRPEDGERLGASGRLARREVGRSSFSRHEAPLERNTAFFERRSVERAESEAFLVLVRPQ